MNKGYFITGTDTNVGKTSATIALMHYFQQQGKTVVGMKPVAAGCDVKEGHVQVWAGDRPDDHPEQQECASKAQHEKPSRISRQRDYGAIF